MFKNNITINNTRSVKRMLDGSKCYEGKKESKGRETQLSCGGRGDCHFQRRAQDGLSEMTSTHMCEGAEVSICQRCLGGKHSK